MNIRSGLEQENGLKMVLDIFMRLPKVKLVMVTTL